MANTVTLAGSLGASSDSGCCGSDVSLNSSNGGSSPASGCVQAMRRVKRLRFHLQLVHDEMLGKRFDPVKDTMYVSGASKSLGAWQVHQAVEMRLLKTPGASSVNQSLLEKLSVMSVSSLSLSSISSMPEVYQEPTPQLQQQQQPNILEFEAIVEAPSDIGHIEINADTQNYKYFFAQKTYLGKDKVFLKQVEYAWRKIPIYETASGDCDELLSSSSVELNDKWPGGEAALDGTVKLNNRVDFGWLSNGENEFQFHFYSNPIQLFTPMLEQKNYWIDIKPWRTLNGLYELKDYVLNYLSFDSNQSVTDKKTKFNSLNYADCYTSMRLRTFENPGDLLFQLNLHEIDDDDRVSEKIIATGYFKVSKTLIENSLIHDLDISLLDANQIIGTLKAEILLITSTQDPSNSLVTKNYNYHFNRSCIPIGHRGMGKTFDAEALPNTTFVENTIESFREAYNRGAQMVEFDIVLTKDKIPIVYHDFVFCVDQLADRSSNNYLSIAVNQLTYEEVKQSRIYSHKILKNAAQLVSNEAREVFTSKLMFPTLKEMCQQLDPKLGFNVEVKYPIDLEDGSNEIDSHIKWLNRNEYIDVVIKELYKWCSDNQRCVIITTFDPNLCSMIRMKQSKFPVLFLTNGVTNKWKPYKDWRCKNTQRSVNYAKAENLHGIVAHAEELTANLHLINILFNNTSKTTNFLAYSWGDELNEIEKRKLLSQSGINGIIYDRINESSTNESD